MNNEPRYYAIDAMNAYPEPVGTGDKLELNLEAGAVYVHLNYKRTKLVGLQSLDFLISQLALIRSHVRDASKPSLLDDSSEPPCSACFVRGCNGECSGDGAMGD